MTAFNIMGNFRNTNEQDLIADLVEEAIEQRGSNVHYIIRDMINPDYLLGESSFSEFKEFYIIPMFIESVEHFNGNGDLYDSFGINSKDSAIFQVGARKFKLDIADKANVVRPREGDLIYLPFSDSLWEITRVKMDLKYFQVGKNNSYRLICSLFTYSHETIESNTETDFNKLGTSTDLDDANIKRLLGISPSLLIDESDVMKIETDSIKNIESTDTFGF